MATSNLMGGGAASAAPSSAEARAPGATIETKMLAGCLAAMALLLLGGGYTYHAGAQFTGSIGWVVHTEEVRAAVANLYASLAGAELAQRDYLLNGESQRLEEQQRLTKLVKERLAALGQLTRDNPAQSRNWASLQSLVNARLARIESAQAAYQTHGLTAARAVLAVGRPAHDAGDVGAVTQRMDALEAQLLAQRQLDSRSIRRTTLISLLATLAAASLLFIALFRGARREMLARRAAEDALRTSEQHSRANRFLDSLLDSLPVMIFVKDAHTFRYVRQNRATLNLLGLASEDVIGKRDSDFLPPEQAEFITSKDREVLASGQLIDIPEQAINTRLGVRTLHTVKMPVLDEQGIAQFLVGISEDITERKRAEQAIHELNRELREKAAELESSNRELESFSYSVSHDLRAPLRAIDGFALMMEEDYHGKLDAEGLRYLEVIRQNSRRMGALIDDLLAFSRLGRQLVTAGEVNVEALVHEVIEEIMQARRRDDGSAAPLPRIEVGPLPAVRGDRSLLRQVWTNLISNAVKYSSKAAEPRIEITAATIDGEHQYSISDNGVGFDMAYAEKLFRVFQRLHRADEFSGTGVGLAIVQRVVTRHGGRVWAQGKVDRGAVFSFALPAGERGG